MPTHAPQREKFRGVIFDLWKTLVPFPDEVKLAAFEAAARALGEAPDTFAAEWSATRALRESQPLDVFLQELRERLGRDWTDVMLDAVIQSRFRIHGAMFARPAPGAVRLLTWIRERGISTAIVSNASSDVRAMLNDSPLAGLVDEVIVSSEVGIMKPSPAIFIKATEAINLTPGECIYVGDGHDRELEASSALGMTSILLDLGEGRSWGGLRITQLEQLINILGCGDPDTSYSSPLGE